MFVLFVVRTVIWNVKWHEGRKDLNSTKMDQREKTPDRQKKKFPPREWMSVSCECCVLSGREVSATGWSIVQRSPTECGVSKSVIVKPRKTRMPSPPRGCRAIKKKLWGTKWSHNHRYKARRYELPGTSLIKGIHFRTSPIWTVTLDFQTHEILKFQAF
jgi:hypothetical protein